VTDKLHNVQTLLDAEASAIRDCLGHLRRANPESLEAHRKIGASLQRVREAAGWKQCLEWAKLNFDFGKTWVARLIWLHREWPAVEAALAWSGDRADTLGSRAKFTPDGAYRLVNEKTVATADRNSEPETKRESPKAKLQRELSEARRRVDQLEAVLRANNLEPPPETDPADTNPEDAAVATDAIAAEAISDEPEANAPNGSSDAHPLPLPVADEATVRSDAPRKQRGREHRQGRTGAMKRRRQEPAQSSAA
jgi:hypothetical protein